MRGVQRLALKCHASAFVSDVTVKRAAPDQLAKRKSELVTPPTADSVLVYAPPGLPVTRYELQQNQLRRAGGVRVALPPMLYLGLGRLAAKAGRCATDFWTRLSQPAPITW